MLKFVNSLNEKPQKDESFQEICNCENNHQVILARDWRVKKSKVEDLLINLWFSP